MDRLFPLFLWIVCLAGTGSEIASAQNSPDASPSSAPTATTQTFAFVNGRVFNGERFIDRPLYVANGRFVDAPPARIDSTIDVDGDFIVPPYGDAHNHHTVDPWIYEKASEDFLAEGTFYSQVLTNRASAEKSTRDFFLRPETMDVSTAQGGITGTLGHPFLAYEPRQMGLPPNEWSEKRDSIASSRILLEDAYWFVDSMDDLERTWPDVVTDAPDIVKIYLLDSVNHPDSVTVDDMGGVGLRQDLVAPIVQRAHASGLRVFAHVETAADVQIAVDAGVDGLGHLPGYGLPVDADIDRYRLPDSLIQQMGRQRMVVTPTTLIGTRYRSDSTRYARIADLQSEMIRKLHDAGARIAIGADWYGRPSFPEYETLASLDVFSPAELLDLWSRVTPQAIFPNRRIGRLQPGYEASLLVLSENALDAPEHATSIRLRLKQGHLLTATP